MVVVRKQVKKGKKKKKTELLILPPDQRNDAGHVMFVDFLLQKKQVGQTAQLF